MPTYEYLCEKCKHRFEVVQRITADPLTECPKCESHIRRVVFPVGVVYKGSGFYTTDYGRGAQQRRSETHSDSADSAAETKLETVHADSHPMPRTEHHD